MLNLKTDKMETTKQIIDELNTNYRMLSSSNINELEEMINKASNDGFRVLKFNDNNDPDNWQGVVIMEKIGYGKD
jgi:hypothetical protein